MQSVFLRLVCTAAPNLALLSLFVCVCVCVAWEMGRWGPGTAWQCSRCISPGLGLGPTQVSEVLQLKAS